MSTFSTMVLKQPQGKECKDKDLEYKLAIKKVMLLALHTIHCLNQI